MCFCGESREEMDSRQVRFIHDHLPDYETQRKKHVMTYEDEDRAKWEAAEAEKKRRQKQLERAIARPKPTHHRNGEGYWVEITRKDLDPPFESLQRTPVGAADVSKRDGGDGRHGRRVGGVEGAKTILQGSRNGQREDIARRTRAALEAQSPF